MISELAVIRIELFETEIKNNQRSLQQGSVPTPIPPLLQLKREDDSKIRLTCELRPAYRDLAFTFACEAMIEAPEAIAAALETLAATSGTY
ncbi:hypothetical protein ACMGDM_16895 [Sphingomonas sp. DT-51]